MFNGWCLVPLELYVGKKVWVILLVLKGFPVVLVSHLVKCYCTVLKYYCTLVKYYCTPLKILLYPSKK